MAFVNRIRTAGLGLLAIFALTVAATAQERDFSDVTVETTALAEDVHLLEGAGGNMVAAVTDDGVLLVDTQFAEMAPKIENALAAFTDKPVAFVINTHYHGDHIGGNAAWAGKGAKVMAQDNQRKRLEAAAERGEMDAAGVPAVTYEDGMTLHLGDETISVYHAPHAHTDGDSLIYFHNADVLHMGDVFRTTSYPRVDAGGGGSLQGILNALGWAIATAGEDTKIVPGHGEVSSRQDVADVLDMMVDIRGRIAEAKRQGKSLEEVQAMAPTAEYDEQWSAGSATGDVITEVIYTELP